MSTLTTTVPQLDVSRLWRSLAATDDSLAQTVARVVLGAVILPHGLQKTLGWFGGYGFTGSMDFFTETIGLPWVVALLAILAESVGALALIAGFGSRIAAVGIGIVMLGAIFTVHLSNGFFMNWYGAQAGEGFEYHLLALALAAVVTIGGAGRASVDRWLASKSG